MIGPGAHIARRAALAAALAAAVLSPAAAQQAATFPDDPAARAALATLEARYTPASQAVVRALAARLRGLADRPDGGLAVAFADPAPIDVAVPAYRADPPLVVDGFAITGHAEHPTQAGRYALHGFLSFTDRFQRRRSVTFGAGYEVAGDSVMVRSVSVAPDYPPLPAVVMLFVPAERVTGDFWSSRSGLDDLLEFALDNAVDFSIPWQVPRAPADLYAMAFFYEELPPAARVDLLVADTPEGMSGERRATVMLREGGFQVAIARVRLAFSDQASVYFKALYRPGDDIAGAEGATRVAEVFSNRVPDLGARPRPAVAAPEPVATQAAPAPVPASAPATAPAADELESRLAAAKRLFEKGLISKDEYEAKRQEILSDL